MRKIPTADDILVNTQDFLAEQGINASVDSSTPEEKINLVLEALAKARNTQSALYGWEPASGSGLRKVKNFIQIKLKNIVLNILEKYVARQQKFNEVAYQTLVLLSEENKSLKQQLVKSKDGN